MVASSPRAVYPGESSLASHLPAPWYNAGLMFTGTPDGSIVERRDRMLCLFKHPALTYTHPNGTSCVIDSAPPQGIQVRHRGPDVRLMKGSEPPSIQEQRRRICEALGRRGEPWHPFSANCQQFTSSVVTGVPRSAALERAALTLFIACVVAPFLFVQPRH